MLIYENKELGQHLGDSWVKEHSQRGEIQSGLSTSKAPKVAITATVPVPSPAPPLLTECNKMEDFNSYKDFRDVLHPNRCSIASLSSLFSRVSQRERRASEKDHKTKGRRVFMIKKASQGAGSLVQGENGEDVNQAISTAESFDLISSKQKLQDLPRFGSH